MNRSQKPTRHLFSVILFLSCLTGAIICQTFQYSKGWTNGKKRSGSTPAVPLIFQDGSEGQEVLGICQMQWLRELLQDKHRDQTYLPCEVLWKSTGSDNIPAEELLQRYRRKAVFETSSNSESSSNHDVI